MSHTATRRPATHASPDLVESYSVGRADRVDRDAGIIYGVRVCGRFSPNCHAMPGVTRGTEYTKAALVGAARLYEGVKVYPKHLPRRNQSAERDPFDSIGALKGIRFDDAADCLRGDLHYNREHPKAPQLVEDAERGLNGFGLSHHIPPGGYKHRVSEGRLLVEAITAVKSVDLVSDPATNSNLFESTTQGGSAVKTFRDVLEAWVADKGAGYKAVAKSLTEEEGDEMMDLPAEAAPADDGAAPEPEDELWAGFLSAIMAIINGDGDASTKAKQIGKYLKAHEKLTADKEPATSDGGGEEDSSEPKESRETNELRVKLICLENGIKAPEPALIEALMGAKTDAARKALIEMKKAAVAAAEPRRVTSGAPRPRPTYHRPAQGAAAVPRGDDFRRSITG